MSQLEYYRTDSSDNLPHQGGLMAWGVVLIVFGSLFGLIGIMSLVWMIVLAVHVLPRVTGQTPGLFAGVVVMYVVLATVLIWLGIGSCKGRRWIRPLMIVGSILMLGSGLLSTITMTWGIVQMIQLSIGKSAGAATFPFNPEIFGFAVGGCFSIGMLLVLPAVLLWFYGRASVKTTLEQMDPVVRWTDNCPLPLLGWTIACVLLGAGLLFSVLKGVVPFFSVILTGYAAIAYLLALSLLLIVGGILCYRQNKLGWLMTFAAVLLLAASMTAFAVLGDHQLYFDLLMDTGIPASQRQFTQNLVGSSLISPAIMYGAAMIYALWLRAVKILVERADG